MSGRHQLLPEKLLRKEATEATELEERSWQGGGNGGMARVFVGEGEVFFLRGWAEVHVVGIRDDDDDDDYGD